MMRWCSAVVCTTDHGRQKRLNLCADTLPYWREKPVWLFSVGSFGDQHPIVGGLIKKEPKEISEFEQMLHPRDYRVFAGVIDLDHWPHGGGSCSRLSAGTRATTASGLRSISGQRRSRTSFERRTESRPHVRRSRFT